MAIATTITQLEEVQSAITAVLSMQSYTLDGVSVTKAMLPALTAREEILLARYQKETTRVKPRVSYANMGGSY